jgi:general secretion pathway protein H
MKRTRNATGGFTLLELIIVLFLAMLMVGMGIVALTGWLPAAKLDAVTREISAMIRQARVLARSSMEKQAVVLNLDERSYGIKGKILRKIPDEISMRVDDPMTGEAEKGIHLMAFSPSGRIEGGAVMLATGRRSVSIRPDPVMGYVVSRRNND